MPKNRLEAFSDGVLAIIITIMVLELKVPHEATAASLIPLLPKLGNYLLSFVYVGIYWNNHHHLFHAARTVTGAVLWANLHLLFWLSLIPLVTDWMGDTHFAPVPTVAYGVVLLMAALAYWLLQHSIIREQGKESILAQALGRDLKGKLSPFMYICAIVAAGFSTWISAAFYVGVALMWLIPDRRIENKIGHSDPVE
jgi:uncharacterized membrane protein